MGYELVFKYHDEISKGEYDREVLKNKNIKIGSTTDEVSLDVVASRIMAQLARRNILVVDVEIYEYTKKKLSYKETEDGILIKNRKYSFDDGVNLSYSEVPDDMPADTTGIMNNQPLLQQLLSLLAGNQNIISDIANNKGIITRAESKPNLAVLPPPSKYLRKEIFNPVQKEMIVDCKNRGMNFTVGKLYPIINERMAPIAQAGMMYTTIDDNGKRFNLSDKFFTPNVNMEYGDQFNEEFIPLSTNAKAGKSADGLDWGGVVENDSLNIR
jgi:hypothetical protein